MVARPLGRLGFGSNDHPLTDLQFSALGATSALPLNALIA